MYQVNTESVINMVNQMMNQLSSCWLTLLFDRFHDIIDIDFDVLVMRQVIVRQFSDKYVVVVLLFERYSMIVFLDLRIENQMNCLYLHLHDHCQRIMVHFQEYMLVQLIDKHVNYNRRHVLMYMNDRNYYLYEKDLNRIHSKTKIK
jgi:hypothetical protein